MRGEYFRGRDLQGEPMLSRVDPPWPSAGTAARRPARSSRAASSPADKALRDDDFSVRWTGQLRPAATGRYEITVTGDDGFRLFVDGQKVIDEWTKRRRARVP